MLDNRKLIAAAVGAAAVAVIGITLIKRKVTTVEEEVVFSPTTLLRGATAKSAAPPSFEPSVPPKEVQVVQEVPIASAPVGIAVAPQADAPADSLEDLLDEAIDEFANPPATYSASALQTKAPGERTTFPNLGLSFELPAGWIAGEAPPAAPTVAIIQLMTPQGDEAGVHILFSVEDLSTENLSIEEYIELQKQAAKEALAYMMNGIQPVQRRSEHIKVGPFSHLLEFSIAQMGMGVTAVQFLAVNGGVTYNLQIMGDPRAEHLEALRLIGESTVISPLEGDTGCVEVTVGGLSMTVPPTWKYTDAETSNAVASFTVVSKVSSQIASLYHEGEEPEEYRAPSRDKKLLTCNSYSFCVASMSEADSPRLSDATLMNVLQSIQSAENTEQSTVFVKSGKYKFVTAPGSAVMSSLVTPDTVVYYPTGLPTNQGEEDLLGIPAAIIRTELEQSNNTLEDWRSQIEEENPEAEFSIVERCEQRCLQVETLEMTETGIGQKSEFRTVSLVFVINGNCFMIRWELGSGYWIRHERRFKAFLEGFRFLC